MRAVCDAFSKAESSKLGNLQNAQMHKCPNLRTLRIKFLLLIDDIEPPSACLASSPNHEAGPNNHRFAFSSC